MPDIFPVRYAGHGRNGNRYRERLRKKTPGICIFPGNNCVDLLPDNVSVTDAER